LNNYFHHQTVAKRYKAGRPDFHALVAEKIKSHLKLQNKVSVCLDVACGTGLLTKALLEISERVIGIDNSEGMLKQAEQNPRIDYILGQAEDLKMINGSMDLITVSSAFHWFDQTAFLKSGYAKLKQNCYIVIHNNSFTLTTDDKDCDAFKNWMVDVYLKKFASPERNQKSVNQSEIQEIGYEFAGEDKFGNVVSFNVEGLMNYLITQSNVISNVELGKYSIEEVKHWLKMNWPFISKKIKPVILFSLIILCI